MTQETSYVLPKLNYTFDALEPVLSAQALELHYAKHHKAYVDNLNAALDKYHEAEIKNDLPSMVRLQGLIEFNGGGHVNHSLFWENLSPLGRNRPEGALGEALNQAFGSFEQFQESFQALALAIQGSGWAFLGYDKTNQDLRLAATSNHGTVSALGLAPLLIVDVWEHAYYLQYKNERARYLKAVFEILDWTAAFKRYGQVV
ncbi:MAG: superoxide dismutase [Parachlamydiales bacterium]|jgi:Fe-Mn family superoxide dismutase